MLIIRQKFHRCKLLHKLQLPKITIRLSLYHQRTFQLNQKKHQWNRNRFYTFLINWKTWLFVGISKMIISCIYLVEFSIQDKNIPINCGKLIFWLKIYNWWNSLSISLSQDRARPWFIIIKRYKTSRLNF